MEGSGIDAAFGSEFVAEAKRGAESCSVLATGAIFASGGTYVDGIGSGVPALLDEGLRTA